LHGLVLVVLFDALAFIKLAAVAPDAEVAKIWQNAYALFIDLPDGFQEPLAIRGIAAVVFDYHVDARFLGVLIQAT
jgi:hypothetical protein